MPRRIERLLFGNDLLDFVEAALRA